MTYRRPDISETGINMQSRRRRPRASIRPWSVVIRQQPRQSCLGSNVALGEIDTLNHRALSSEGPRRAREPRAHPACRSGVFSGAISAIIAAPPQSQPSTAIVGSIPPVKPIMKGIAALLQTN